RVKNVPKPLIVIIGLPFYKVNSIRIRITSSVKALDNRAACVDDEFLLQSRCHTAKRAKMTSLLQSIPSPTKIRDELEQMVLKDLIGPVGGPEEEIDEQ